MQTRRPPPNTSEPGYSIPAEIGMAEGDIQTPCLILDLDALERNIAKMGELAKAMGVRHRAHGKMHKSVDVARLQMELGGACGICCQKVSEAEAFARGGIGDILVSNEVRDPAKIDRLARLARLGARVMVCVDDIDNVAELSAAAERHGTTVECLVELECGAGRCGVTSTEAAIEIARAVEAAPGLTFTGLQAYHGSAQHLSDFDERREKIEKSIALTREAVDGLAAAGFACETVTGAGTGSFYLEGASGVYTEVQCGSYAFMDAAYARIAGPDGRPLGDGAWEHALFVLTSVMSLPVPGRAVCDAGLKAHSIDSGLPVVHGRDGIEYLVASDEHGVLADPAGELKINERLRLVPGHCDPTCNLHDWYVGVRGGVVETLWPVTARGPGY